MFKNYFKTAWRNIIRSKGYSALNIFGLATGMAVALMIGLWVHYQYSYDKFLPKYEQLYQVRRNYHASNGEILNFTSTSLKLADALRNQIPEIEYVAECRWGQHGLMVGDKKLFMGGMLIQSDFLKMFQYPLLQGNRNTAMKDAYSIVLTESTAKALFGNENAIGKTVRFDNKSNLAITAVLKDLPSNSSFSFNYLVPFSYFEQTADWVKQQRAGSFGENSYGIYAKLKDGISYARIAPKIKDIEKTEKDNTNAMLSDVIMQPLKDWHLYSEYKNGKAESGFVEYVNMFSIIGAFVLLIACINFINLTTARSEKRAREVGVRKAVGSQRKDIIIQFLAESFLLTFIAFLVSLLLVQLALPTFISITDNKINIPFSNISFWIITLVCVVLTALIAGSRPAFYLSSFQPVKVLKGAMHVGKAAALPRKILVVLQFSCSVALIISTIIIYQQVQLGKDRPTGYDLNRLMITEMNDDLLKNYSAVKNELIQKGIAENVTAASSPATDIWWHSDVDYWPGKNAGETIEMGTVIVAEDYFKTLGIGLREGRFFKNANDTNSVVFNEAAIKQMRIKDPVNQTITWGGKQFQIVGIAKDALMTSPFMPAEPTMFLCYPANPVSNLMYRLSPRIKTHDAITQLTAIFNKYNPAYPFDYRFADADFEKKFKLEVLIGKLSGIFAGLAIFISCLGLFGLAAYVAEQRTKEIGIRKVLGATISQVWLLLSKDFIVLVLISCVIASPIALYFLQNWLEKYSYRINIGAGVFVLAAAMAVVITLLTISFQAIKAAIANPVKSLRTE